MSGVMKEHWMKEDVTHKRVALTEIESVYFLSHTFKPFPH